MGMTDLSTATVVQFTAVQSAAPFPSARKPASDLPGTGPVDLIIAVRQRERSRGADGAGTAVVQNVNVLDDWPLGGRLNTRGTVADPTALPALAALDQVGMGGARTCGRTPRRAVRRGDQVRAHRPGQQAGLGAWCPEDRDRRSAACSPVIDHRSIC
jgi:hypothetical protein